MSKPESGLDAQSHNIVLLDRINCKDIGSGSGGGIKGSNPRDSSSTRPSAMSNPAITVMASSSRIFAGGNEDGEIFAFALNGLSSGTFNDPVVQFPSNRSGTPVTAMSIANMDSSTVDNTVDGTDAIDVIYAGFADGHVRIYRTRDHQPEMSMEIAAHVRTTLLPSQCYLASSSMKISLITYH